MRKFPCFINLFLFSWCCIKIPTFLSTTSGAVVFRQFVLFSWTDWATYDLSTQIPTHPVMASTLHTNKSKHILCTAEHLYNMVHYNTVLHKTWLGLQFTVAILIAFSTYKLWPNIWCGIHTKWWGICKLSSKVHHHNNNWWQKAASNFFTCI